MLALACLLAGCSSVRLAYNNVPTFGTWWLNGYLDFDDSQSTRLREDLASLQQWHRSTQLPEMAGLLQRAQTLAAQEHIAPAQACALVDDVQRQLADIAAHSEPGAAQLVRSLTPTQLQHLESKYSKTNEEFRKEWLALSPDKLHEKRYDKTLDRAEHFYGRLSAEQRALLRRQIDASSYDPRKLQAERLRRQQDTLQTLRSVAGEQATPEQAERALRGLFARYRQSPQADYRAYAQRQIEEGCEGLALLHDSTTPAQRDNAVKRLQAYEKDFRSLAAQR
ncbi:DUF6279 family lipoprotein [Pseudorhodoferax aquiterrae]|uniref:DUF6279 family lipoprotein n=1 Tax=Pseudorhodoferax aquiterrae TaxID=747304 RepID=UPI0016748836|nr:DUF6279 family lipoprotein [Pseudorhodoferax aquiterrae]